MLTPLDAFIQIRSTDHLHVWCVLLGQRSPYHSSDAAALKVRV